METLLQKPSTQVTATIEGILGTYNQIAPADDEMLGTDGQIKASWLPFFQGFQKLGNKEIVNRNEELIRLLKENGVTYNIYNDPNGLNRPWQLDPIPLIIDSKEWSVLEKGIQERAALMNFILEDLYGKRELIKTGLLPLELVYSHPGFIRECDQIKPLSKVSLPIYAADIVRGNDGNPWVLNDRTQAPSGTGYTLENRMAMSRIFPDIFENYEIRKVSHFFNKMRHILNAVAPRQKENPKIVVLTPGPRNETYFEHSYLASYLGLTLVQGEDLTVREHFVYLKSLNGLERVDVILRRVDDIFCDPLELRDDSQLGVPGLLNVVRKGNVFIINPLGCSILENPGLMAFLPGISNMVLGKDLSLPSVATWWCGQKNELGYVIDNIDRLIIKRTYRINNKDSIIGGLLSKTEKENLKREIKSNPNMFVGQEQLNFSTAPLFFDGKAEPRYVVLRGYALGDETGYTVMPGGLTRCSPEKGLFVISNQTGGISKDTWVIGKEPDNHVNVTIGLENMTYSHVDSLPSRTAENLFWMGRYAERTLYMARTIRTLLKSMDEGPKFNEQSDVESKHILFKNLTNITMSYPGFIGEGAESRLANPTLELLSLVLDTQRQGSLSYNIQYFNRACFSVRDQLALDTWRILDGLGQHWGTLKTANNTNLRQVQNGLDSLITSMVAFLGLNNESMTRENAWLIFDIGRKIELGQLITTMIRGTLVYKLNHFSEYTLQEAVLAGNESLITYRYRYRSLLKLNYVLDLLIMDSKNPRSLAFQLENLRLNLEKLPNKSREFFLSSEEKFVLDAYTKLNLADTKMLSQSSHKFLLKELDNLMSTLNRLLADTSLMINQKYFSHSLIQQQLGKSQTEYI